MNGNLYLSSGTTKDSTGTLITREAAPARPCAVILHEAPVAISKLPMRQSGHARPLPSGFTFSELPMRQSGAPGLPGLSSAFSELPMRQSGRWIIV